MTVTVSFCDVGVEARDCFSGGDTAGLQAGRRRLVSRGGGPSEARALGGAEGRTFLRAFDAETLAKARRIF